MNETLPQNPSAVAKKSILFVDDDVEYLQVVDRLLRLWSDNTLEVLTAPNATVALAAVNEHHPDVIVLDMSMPVIDGLQLLSLLNRRCPGTPKVVMTGHSDQSYRTACLNNGAELFLEKPRDSEGFETIFATLDELTRWKPEPGFRGVLRSVGLTDVIQMECIARSSSILSVTSQELNGRIYIRDGTIIQAEAGESRGEEAFKRLIALVSGDFRSLPFAEPLEQSIHLPWETLLMDAAQARDEFLGAKELEPSLPPPSVAAPAASPAPARPSLPIEIDELVICSKAGDVYHAWQCENTELRLNLLGFLAQKTEVLARALPVGVFERAEFIASGSRLIAEQRDGRGVIVRCSLAGVAAAKNDPNFGLSGRGQSAALVQKGAHEWFEQRVELAGLHVASLQFPDRSGPFYSRAPKLTEEEPDLLRRIVSDGFQVLKLQRFYAQRTRWIFDQTVLECAHWPDGTALACLFNRRTLEMNTQIVEEHLNAFLKLQHGTRATAGAV